MIQSVPSGDQIQFLSVGDKLIRAGEMIARHNPARITEGDFSDRFFKGKK